MPRPCEQNQALEAQSLIQARAIASHEADVSSLSGMVIERERTIRDLTERLEEANACHDRSIASLDAVSARLEDLQAQARGQATRIRMKALREAVELSGKAQALAEAEDVTPPRHEPAAEEPEPEIAAEVAEIEEAAPQPTANGSNGHPTATATAPTAAPSLTSWEPGLYEGKIRLEIGPLGDFSQRSESRTPSAVSAPPTSRSNASPRAARPSRCGSSSRSTSCVNWRPSPPSTSRSATPRPTT